MRGWGVWSNPRAFAGWRAAGALVMLCAAVYLPGVFSIPPVDRDECRFAQASRQMLQSGDWVVPRFQDRTRLNKPPLIYWLQAGTAWLLNDLAAREPLGIPPPPDEDPTGGLWRYRLPSVVAATLTVLLSWRLGRRMFDARAAWLGAAMLAVCPMLAWDAHQARSDQVLLTTIVVSQTALWAIWRSRHHPARPWLAPLVLWGSLTLGVLTKGPVAPMVVGLTALAVGGATREWRWLARARPLLGVVVLSAAGGTWLSLVAGQVGWDHLAERLRRELIDRNTSAQEGHWGPPGYHLAAFLLLFWPGTLATLAGVLRAWRVGFGGRGLRVLRSVATGREAELFCLAWVLPAWLVFEIVGTKLPHYTLPLYPPLALLSARALLSLRPRPGRKRAVGLDALIPWAIVGVALLAVFPSVLAAAVTRDAAVPSLPNVLALVARGAALALLAASVLCLWRGRLLVGQLASIAAVAVSLGALLGLTIPYLLDEAQVSTRLVRAVRTTDPELRRPLASVGYHEDSLVFLTGGRVQRIDHPARTPSATDLLSFFAANPTGIAIVPSDRLRESSNLGIGDGPPFVKIHAIGALSGWNYSRGRRVELTIIEVQPPSARTGKP